MVTDSEPPHTSSAKLGGVRSTRASDNATPQANRRNVTAAKFSSERACQQIKPFSKAWGICKPNTCLRVLTPRRCHRGVEYEDVRKPRSGSAAAGVRRGLRRQRQGSRSERQRGVLLGRDQRIDQRGFSVD